MKDWNLRRNSLAMQDLDLDPVLVHARLDVGVWRRVQLLLPTTKPKAGPDRTNTTEPPRQNKDDTTSR